MIIVTGGSGFIGSNLVRSFAADGHDVTIVDDIDPHERGLLDGITVTDRLGLDALRARLEDPHGLDGVDAVVHQGACSSTTETDEAFLTRNNLDFSVAVLDACQRARVPLVYASSASVYGLGASFTEDLGSEQPLNGYARSKARFDQHVARRLDHLAAPVVGLRYFNVYGPGEAHKQEMASQAWQLAQQISSTGVGRLFGAGEGAVAGEHRRDFVFVDDVVAVVRWFLDHPERSGVFNCGTGTSRTFRELADAVVAALGTGRIEYVPFPASLRGRYQSCTQADLTRLRSTGCDIGFTPIEVGVAAYLSPPRPGTGPS